VDFLELYVERNLDYNALMGEVLKNLVDDFRWNHHKEDADALILVDELMRAFAFTSDSLSKEAAELSKSLRWRQLPERQPEAFCRGDKTERNPKGVLL
jgi:hypothetical protein